MENLVVFETDKGHFAVRPIEWAGIWNADGKIQECGIRHTAIFATKEDAEWYANTKNAEEQGLLLRLPFSKETPVYHIENKEVVERKLEHVVISLWLRETTDKDFGGVCFGKNAICAHTDDIGKTVFLMQAEAEQKLKEMESK